MDSLLAPAIYLLVFLILACGYRGIGGLFLEEEDVSWPLAYAMAASMVLSLLIPFGIFFGFLLATTLLYLFTPCGIWSSLGVTFIVAMYSRYITWLINYV